MTIEEMMGYDGRFLPTPSARRATITDSRGNVIRTYFYPRPPRGGRRMFTTSCQHLVDFYPRPPRGGRPDYMGADNATAPISTHALREEGDTS